MKIILKKIDIENFMNTQKYTHEFNNTKEIITAKVGDGKTTIFNAYKWAFGIDSADYEPCIQRKKIKGLKTIVSVDFDVDGVAHTLERTSTRKDKTVSNSFLVDGEKIKTLSAYRTQIESILGIEFGLLQTLIDINSFNTYTWQAQRKFLFDLFKADDVTKGIIEKKKYAWIKDNMTNGKDEITLLQTLKKDGKIMEKNVADLTANIMNNKGIIARLSQVDFESLEKDKAELEEQKHKLLTNASKIEEMNAITTDIASLNDELAKARFKANQENSKLQNDIRAKEDELRKIKDLAQETKANLDVAVDGIDSNTKAIKDIEQSTFDKSNMICKLCGQKLPQDKIDEAEKSFESNKQDSLARYKDFLIDCQNKQKTFSKGLNKLNIDYKATKTALDELKATKIDTSTIDDLTAKIKAKEEELKALTNANNEVENAQAISELDTKIKEIDLQLANKVTIDTLTKDNEEQTAKRNDLRKQDVNRLKMVDLVNEFTMEKVNAITSMINSHFENVAFMFFRFNLGDEECHNDCIPMYKGTKVYDNCSSGEKISTNYYITKSLQKNCNVNLPIFLDDMGIVGEFDCDSQYIGLLTDVSGKKSLDNIKISDVYTLEDCE